MSTTLDRISKEQWHQTFFPLSDASFEGGKLHIGEHVQCVAGALAGNATYVLNLPPAGAADGCICSITVNVGADSVLTVQDGPNKLFDAVTNVSICALLFCDGILWRVVWDRNVLAALTALHDQIPVPEGGTKDQLLAKASADDGDLVWTTVPKIPAGGTTGQALAKKSGDDFDLEWIDLT